MPVPLQPSSAGPAAVSRPLVACLFVSSVLLSVVSWYTTQQGMALYLSPWFSFLASLGVQSALVLVAWLVGVTEVPPRPARRRLRRHRRRLDRLLVRQPPHLVRLARATGHDRAGPLRRARRRGREVAGAPHRRRRRGAEARAGARRDDGGREGPRLHLARHGPGPVPRPGPRGGGPRGGELRRLLPRGPGPGAALHGLRPAREHRPADGRAAPGVAEVARRFPGGPASRSTRPRRSSAASGRCSTRSRGATCGTRCTSRSRSRRCPRTPPSSTGRPPGRRTW